MKKERKKNNSKNREHIDNWVGERVREKSEQSNMNSYLWSKFNEAKFFLRQKLQM